jgi:hypothetical protein
MAVVECLFDFTDTQGPPSSAAIKAKSNPRNQQAPGVVSGWDESVPVAVTMAGWG